MTDTQKTENAVSGQTNGPSRPNVALTQPELLSLGVAAAQAIKNNLPVDAFGDPRRLNDYADIWGAAARNAVLACLAEIQETR